MPLEVTYMYNTLVRGTALLIASLATTAAWAADETPTTQAFRAYLDHCHAAHVCNGAYLAARGGKTIFVGAVGDAGDAARTPLTADSAFDIGRSEERRVGKECVSTGRSRWSPYHSKKITINVAISLLLLHMCF